MTRHVKAVAPGRVRRAGAVAAGLGLAGVVNAGVQVREHLLFHTTPAYRSFCEITESFTCRSVALSDWSVALGLPVAAWGVLGSLALGAAGLWVLVGRGRARHALGVLLGLAGGAVLASVALLSISTFVIGALCPLCALSHAINVAIAVTAFLAVRAAGGLRSVATDTARWALTSPERALGLAAPPLALAILAVAFVPRYWEVEASPRGPGGLSVGADADGAPWIGAEAPEVTIVEFSDYQCPHCSRGHREVRELVAAHPGARLVHCQYPLDRHCNPAIGRPFHERACDLACLAFCAGEQDRFWEANDYLFSCEDQAGLTSEGFAEAVGLDCAALERCLSSPRPQRALERDLAAARRLGVGGTPTYVVDGRLYPGRLPPDVLDGRAGDG